MDTGKLKTFTHLSVFTPRKRSSWAIYLVVQFAVGSVFFWFSGYQNKLDPTNQAVPFDIDVMLFPKVLSMGEINEDHNAS